MPGAAYRCEEATSVGAVLQTFERQQSPRAMARPSEGRIAADGDMFSPGDAGRGYLLLTLGRGEGHGRR